MKFSFLGNEELVVKLHTAGWVLFVCYGEAKSVAVSEEKTGCFGSEKG